MSEENKPKVEVELKEEDRKLLRSAIDALSNQKSVLATPQPTGSTSPSFPKQDEAEAKAHKSVKEMLECKDCGKEARELILTPLQGQKIVKCKGCGVHVGENEAKCPSCGSTSAE
jgi:rubrerythrin